MKMLCWMNSKTRRDRIKNYTIRETSPIVENIYDIK